VRIVSASLAAAALLRAAATEAMQREKREISCVPG
jgi:hypothetical protein